jgi:hypothetical protein
MGKIINSNKNKLRAIKENYSPFKEFFKNLYLQHTLNPSSYLAKQKIKKISMAILITPEADCVLFQVMREVTHTSFLNFCIYLVHSRITEYSYLKSVYRMTEFPVMITAEGVKDAVSRYLKFFEFIDVKFTGIQAPIKENYFIFPVKIFEAHCSKEYNNRKDVAKFNEEMLWNVRDPTDCFHYNTFLIKVEDNVMLGGITEKSSLPTPQSLSNLRQHILEIRENIDLWYSMTKDTDSCKCKLLKEPILIRSSPIEHHRTSLLKEQLTKMNILTTEETTPVVVQIFTTTSSTETMTTSSEPSCSYTWSKPKVNSIQMTKTPKGFLSKPREHRPSLQNPGQGLEIKMHKLSGTISNQLSCTKIIKYRPELLPDVKEDNSELKYLLAGRPDLTITPKFAKVKIPKLITIPEEQTNSLSANYVGFQQHMPVTSIYSEYQQSQARINYHSGIYESKPSEIVCNLTPLAMEHPRIIGPTTLDPLTVVCSRGIFLPNKVSGTLVTQNLMSAQSSATQILVNDQVILNFNNQNQIQTADQNCEISSSNAIQDWIEDICKNQSEYLEPVSSTSNILQPSPFGCDPSDFGNVNTLETELIQDNPVNFGEVDISENSEYWIPDQNVLSEDLEKNLQHLEEKEEILTSQFVESCSESKKGQEHLESR